MNEKEMMKQLIAGRVFQNSREKEMIEGIFAREGPYFAKAASIICENSWTILQTISVLTHFVPKLLGEFLSDEYVNMLNKTDMLLLAHAAQLSNPRETDAQQIKRCEEILSLLQKMRTEAVDLMLKEIKIANPG